MKIFIVFLTLLPYICISQIQIGNILEGDNQGDHYGISVAIAANGDIVAVGAEKADGANGTQSGNVRIYNKVDNSWVQIGGDIDGEGFGDRFGHSVDLSSDGTIVAIGGYRNHFINETPNGHVRVFRNIDNNWVQIGSDIDGEESGDNFGFSVSLSSDGETVAVGGNTNNGINGSGSGHVRIFKNIDDIWVQIGDDIDGENAGDLFGSSVSLSANGNIVAIGGIRNDGENALASGHVRVFENIDNNWVQLGQDIDGLASSDEFGKSVSISSDGKILAIGAPNHGSSGFNNGLTQVFNFNDDSWNQIGANIIGENFIDNSGRSISLSASGDILAIGAYNNNPNGDGNNGHVRIFKNINGNWTQLGDDIDGLDTGDISGYSVALSEDGSKVAVGAPEFMGFPTDDLESGYVRIFDLDQVLTIGDNILSKIHIYPNPSRDRLIIKNDHSLEIKRINFYNSIGEKVLSTETNIINISNLQIGLYLVELVTNKGSITKRLIVN